MGVGILLAPCQGGNRVLILIWIESFYEGSWVDVNGNCLFSIGPWFALTSPGWEPDSGPWHSFELCQSLCFRACSKDVSREWTIHNYSNGPLPHRVLFDSHYIRWYCDPCTKLLGFFFLNQELDLGLEEWHGLDRIFFSSVLCLAYSLRLHFLWVRLP